MAPKNWGGELKNSHLKIFEKGVKMHNMMSHIKVRHLTTYHILLVEFRELPYLELYALKFTMGF